MDIISLTIKTIGVDTFTFASTKYAAVKKRIRQLKTKAKNQ
jgi:hypothetical protein